jgi:long-chain acyl-CoA synthetase
MNIADIVRLHAQRMPDQRALADNAESIDWATAQARIEAAAWHLREHGVAAGDVVALSLRRGLPSVILAMAVARLGASWCTVDFRARPAERDTLLAAIAPRLILADRQVGASAWPMAAVDEQWHTWPAGGGAPPMVADPAAPAALILSSGTTGAPKAAGLSHEAAAWRGVVRCNEAELRPGTRVLNTLSLAASACVSGVLAQILAGATTYFCPAIFTPEELVEQVNALQIEQTTVVPTIVRGLLGLGADERYLMPQIRQLFVLGSAFHAEEKRLVMSRVTPMLFEHYGAAGAGPIATATPEVLARAPTTVGYPAPFVRIEIVDEGGHALPPGETGRVRVRTPGAATPAIGDVRDEGAERIVDGWVYPGDLGRMDDDGALFLEGRAASIIIRGGQNLYPEEIERVLLTHPGVLEAAVIGRSEPQLGEVPVALVVAQNDLSITALAEHCRGRLQPAKVPVAFHLVDALPKTPTGKVRRADLSGLVPG